MKDAPLVYLEWVDSASPNTAWIPADHSVKPDRIKTIGWVIEDNDEYITVSNQVGEQCMSGVVAIPKVAITHRREIKRVKLGPEDDKGGSGERDQQRRSGQSDD